MPYVYVSNKLGYDSKRSVAIKNTTKGEKETVPYIHFNGKHFSNKFSIKSKTTRNKILAIKQRYYQTMQQQIAGMQSSPDTREIIELMQDTAKIEELVNTVEKKLVDTYNNNISSITTAFGSNLESVQQRFNEAYKKLKNITEDKTLDTAKAFEGLQDLILIFSNDPKTASLISNIADPTKRTKQMYNLLPKDVLNIRKFVNLIDKIAKQGGILKNGDHRSFSSNLTNPTEFLAALGGLEISYAESFAVNKADKTVIDAVRGVRTGMKSKQAFVTIKGINYSVEDKAVDFIMGNEEINHTIKLSPITGKSGEIEHKFTLKGFASNKYYFSDSKIHLISHHGDNSFLIPALQALYGTTMPKAYVYYNALAFNESQSNEALNNNFRILRQDLAVEYAEKFLSGFGDNDLQSVLVYNLKAYPVGLIICDIVADMLEHRKNHAFIGDRNSLFSISFSRENFKTYNSWQLGPQNSLQGAFTRIKNIMDAIRQTTISGTFNPKQLNNTDYIKRMVENTRGGIEIL